MKIGYTKPEPGLVFSRVHGGRTTVRGVLTDKQGNLFDIQIIGTDPKQIEKFIRYQKRQAKKGKGIQVQVIPLPDYRQRRVFQTGKAKAQASWQGMSLRLTERSVKPAGPHKLIVTIDPPIEPNKSQDYQIDNQRQADVQCNVEEGSVRIELFEFTDALKTQTKSVVTREIGELNLLNVISESQKFTGNWNVRVTGLEAANKFQLRLNLIID